MPALRSVVLSIDPNQPITSIKTMENIVADSIAQQRLNMVLMGLFGMLALLLATVGIYGLLSYAVTQRTQEMGIRMALGARMTDVLKLILKQGMMLVLVWRGTRTAGGFGFHAFIESSTFRSRAHRRVHLHSGFGCADDSGSAGLLRSGAKSDEGRSTGGVEVRMNLRSQI